jgi:hypothetical protein
MSAHPHAYPSISINIPKIVSKTPNTIPPPVDFFLRDLFAPFDGLKNVKGIIIYLLNVRLPFSNPHQPH